MNILVECKPDMALIESLEIPGYLFHSTGKSRVIRRIIKDNNPSIGIIDEDPGKPYPKSFKEEFDLVEESSQYSFKIMRHKNKPSYLILLNPRLEEWILEACKEVSISPLIYSLPEDPDELHKRINLNVTHLMRLLDDIKERSGRIKALQGIIISLMESS